MAAADFVEPIGEDNALLAADEEPLLRQLLGRYDVPAYVRRGLRVEAAIRHFFAQAEAHYRTVAEPLVASARALARLVPGPPAFAQALAAPETAGELEALLQRLAVRLPWGARRASQFAIRGAARQLAEAIDRFNRRWLETVQMLDYAAVNREIEGYNRYYLLEKECALRSRHVAARGFRPLRPIDPPTVLARYPLLGTGAAELRRR